MILLKKLRIYCIPKTRPKIVLIFIKTEEELSKML